MHTYCGYNNNYYSADSTYTCMAAILTILTIGTFAEQLKNNSTLRRLDLRECGLTSLSTKSLTEALTTNKYLQELNISGNPLCDDGIQHLAHSLRVNQGLNVLCLRSCSLTSLSAESLAGALATNNHLEKLDISGNALCDDSIAGIQRLGTCSQNQPKFEKN